MGRSGGGGRGGSSGGSRRSSGGFGGARSSGGFSGGGRSFGSTGGLGGRSTPPSSGGLFGGRSTPPSSGGLFGGRPTTTYRPPIVISSYKTSHQTFGSPTVTSPPPSSGPIGQGPSPKRTSKWVIWVLLFVIFMAITIALSAGPDSGNTTKRTPLSGQVHKTERYSDQIGWISNKQVLIDGLEQFYKKTGVQPYVLLLPYHAAYWNEDGSINADTADAYLETVYTQTFTDEAHFIFAYFAANEDSKGEMEGDFRYLSGYSADTIMDSEAIKIFWGFFQTNYYDTKLTLESMIADTFVSTSEQIMSRPTNSNDLMLGILVVLGGVTVLALLTVSISHIFKRRREKEEYTKQILETPLETFADQDTAELEEKYKD